MQFDARLVPAQFIRRENRFRVTVEAGGNAIAAHLPNSGRLQELLTPGRPVWLRPASAPGRRTAYDLLLVDFAYTLVSVDARLPNRLLHEALLAGRLSSFAAFDRVRREVQLEGSRLDFLLEADHGRLWLETKSVTLVEEGVALFPDAPTARGRRHVETLARAVAAGDRAAVVFVIQRSDAASFSPHPSADPPFVTALGGAKAAGVELLAYGCRVDLTSIHLDELLPVRLQHRGFHCSGTGPADPL